MKRLLRVQVAGPTAWTLPAPLSVPREGSASLGPVDPLREPFWPSGKGSSSLGPVDPLREPFGPAVKAHHHWVRQTVWVSRFGLAVKAVLFISGRRRFDSPLVSKHGA